MKRTSIGTKIALGFALALFGVLLIGANAWVNSARMVKIAMQKDSSRQAMLTMNRLLISAVDAETGVRGFVLTGRASYLVPYREGMAGFPAEMDQLRSLLGDRPAQQQGLATLQPLLNQVQQEWAQTISVRRSQGFRPAANLVDAGQGKMLMDQIRQQIADLQAAEQKQMDARSALQQKVASNVQHTAILLPLLIALLVVIVTARITRNIANPLQAVTEAAREIALGNFDIQLSVGPRGDEIGKLSESFQHMSESLRELAVQAEKIAAGDLTGDFTPRGPKDLLGHSFAAMRRQLVKVTSQLGESSAVLAASVQQILAAVGEVNSGVTETAASVTQTTATVEEVRQTASLSSQKARAVSEIAQRSVEISNEGKSAVEAAITGMERIRQQTEAIAESIVRLNEHGQAIGEIIAVVNDLSEQSNLLAVNAAIEAVRAGEHGRSFAVVAQEVRSLADQSRQATAQIRGILNEVQKATSAAVMTAEQGSRAVEAGLQQAARSGGAMRQLESTIAEASRAAIQIAASSQQQLVGMDQIAEAIESIKQASVQNVTSAQQVQAAAHHLQPVGQEMELLIRLYRTTAAGA